MKFQIKKRDGSIFIPEIEAGSVLEIFTRISKLKNININRIRLEKDKLVLDKDAPLKKYDLRDNSSLVFKDLGLQIGWKTVFIIEYLGPMIIYPAFFFFPNLFYPSYPDHPKTNVQMLLFLT